MSQRNVLILERSSQNLRKTEDKERVILEGVFAEFGIENRNGRIYEEKEYLPHLTYLKKDMANSSLLGELDHPERFEVALGNVSHRITELWYDQSSRQVKGRIEVLDTPKGQIAKALLDAGVPLSISSRAAGTVNEDKTVQIQQIYTYDLVAKPGFESAQLKTVNEGAKARINNLIAQLNESSSSRKDHSIASKLGIINENISILDLTDQFPSIKLREEALALQKELNDKNKNDKNMKDVNEEILQQWTVFFKKELAKINERLSSIEVNSLEGNNKNLTDEINLIKKYVEKLRKVQENSINWQGNIAKAVNNVASYADTLAEKNNKHYTLTKKAVSIIDENAKVLNYTQDWIGENAKVTNVIAETVDHNAKMLNGINEWNTEIAKGINELHEWGSEKAKAINGMHEWTSTIAKNLNQTANWSEDMFGRAMSKEDAKKLIQYVELVSESKSNPALKKYLNETLSKHNISGKPLTESCISGIKGVKGIGVLTDVKTAGNSKVDTATTKPSGVILDDKSKAILAKIRSGKFSKSIKPKELKTISSENETAVFVKTGSKVKGVMVLDTVKSGSKPLVKISSNGPTSAQIKDQNLKLDTKSGGLKEARLNRTEDLRNRSSKLDEKLSKIISTIEKEKKVDESIKSDFPFTALLNESNRMEFAALSLSDKKKVADVIKRNPTIDSGVIKALWENTLASEAIKASVKEPIWLASSPKEYREIYESSTSNQKAAINARAEFYTLDTQYQIENFWQTSGLNPKKEKTSLNEVFTTKNNKNEGSQKLSSFISSIGEQMKRYN